MGPALFTIYLNDIPSIPDVCSLESYVDDSKLYLSFPVAEASNMIQQINKDLEKIASWCCYNSLLINPEKTKLLVLGTRQMLQRLPADFHVTLLGKKVTPSPSARDLGLQVDGTLSNDEHVTQTVSSCISSFKLSLIETDEKPGANFSPPKQGACYCGQRSKTRKKLFVLLEVMRRRHVAHVLSVTNVVLLSVNALTVGIDHLETTILTTNLLVAVEQTIKTVVKMSKVTLTP